MRPVTDQTIERLVAFHGHTSADYARLAYDTQAAIWVLHEKLIGDDRFRFELRERWEQMDGARRSKFRRKGVPWLMEVHRLAIQKIQR